MLEKSSEEELLVNISVGDPIVAEFGFADEIVAVTYY